MVQRIDSLQENGLVEEIAGIVTDFNALKSSSQLLGGDSVTIKNSNTGNTYDIDISMAAWDLHSWRIVFVPTVMRFPFAQLLFAVNESNANFGEVWYAIPNAANTTESQLAWDFTFSNANNAQTVQVTFGVECSDTGGIRVSQTS